MWLYGRSHKSLKSLNKFVQIWCGQRVRQWTVVLWQRQIFKCLSVNGKKLSEIWEKGKQKPWSHMGTHGADIMNGPDIEFDNTGGSTGALSPQWNNMIFVGKLKRTPWSHTLSSSVWRLKPRQMKYLNLWNDSIISRASSAQSWERSSWSFWKTVTGVEWRHTLRPALSSQPGGSTCWGPSSGGWSTLPSPWRTSPAGGSLSWTRGRRWRRVRPRSGSRAVRAQRRDISTAGGWGDRTRGWTDQTLSRITAGQDLGAGSSRSSGRRRLLVCVERRRRGGKSPRRGWNLPTPGQSEAGPRLLQTFRTWWTTRETRASPPRGPPQSRPVLPWGERSSTLSRSRSTAWPGTPSTAPSGDPGDSRPAHPRGRSHSWVTSLLPTPGPSSPGTWSPTPASPDLTRRSPPSPLLPTSPLPVYSTETLTSPFLLLLQRPGWTDLHVTAFPA